MALLSSWCKTFQPQVSRICCFHSRSVWHGCLPHGGQEAKRITGRGQAKTHPPQACPNNMLPSTRCTFTPHSPITPTMNGPAAFQIHQWAKPLIRSKPSCSNWVAQSNQVDGHGHDYPSQSDTSLLWLAVNTHLPLKRGGHFPRSEVNMELSISLTHLSYCNKIPGTVWFANNIHFSQFWSVRSPRPRSW